MEGKQEEADEQEEASEQEEPDQLEEVQGLCDASFNGGTVSVVGGIILKHY